MLVCLTFARCEHGHSQWVKKHHQPPRYKYGYSAGITWLGFRYAPDTPRVKATLYGYPPINWFQKGNKKPRVESGVQILKNKRLG